MGPLLIYSTSNYRIKNEDIMMLLSLVKPYAVSDESSLMGPSYLGDRVIMTYNRCLNCPEAKDERIRLMGTECWVLLSCEKDYEVVLLGQIDVAKMILDIEFDQIMEVNQYTTEIAEHVSSAIEKIYL